MGQEIQDDDERFYSLVDGPESADVSEEVSSAAGAVGSGRVDALICSSLIANVATLVAKVIVAFSSGALVACASALDSLSELLYVSVLLLTAGKTSRHARDKLPAGDERMEHLGVVALAAVMCTCYLHVVGEAVSRLTAPWEVVCDDSVLALLLSIVAARVVLYFLCRAALSSLASRSPALETQAHDHLSGCLTTALTAVTTFLASSPFSRLAGLGSPAALHFIDPVSAAMFGGYLIYAWVQVARESASSLLGRASDAELLQRITYLATVHSSEIVAVDTVCCYSFGPSYVAEVDIIMPPDMTRKQAHDIGESLRTRIEALEEISHCSVYIDWERTPKPKEA